jgi:hypothetical protein
MCDSCSLVILDDAAISSSSRITREQESHIHLSGRPVVYDFSGTGYPFKDATNRFLEKVWSDDQYAEHGLVLDAPSIRSYFPIVGILIVAPNLFKKAVGRIFEAGYVPEMNHSAISSSS